MSKEARDFCKALMVRNPAKRLGVSDHAEKEIKTHPFFRRIDWVRLEAREIQPPFKPKIVSRGMLSTLPYNQPRFILL